MSRIDHRITLPEWYATQQGRSVHIFARGESKPAKILIPPEEWGASWAWNLTETGVYFVRTDHA